MIKYHQTMEKWQEVLILLLDKPLNISEVCKLTPFSYSYLVSMSVFLEEKNLALRERDGRRVFLCLTKEGERFAKTLKELRFLVLGTSSAPKTPRRNIQTRGEKGLPYVPASYVPKEKQ